MSCRLVRGCSHEFDEKRRRRSLYRPQLLLLLARDIRRMQDRLGNSTSTKGWIKTLVALGEASHSLELSSWSRLRQ